MKKYLQARLDARNLDGQTLATLGAASIDHGAATTGFHTDAETVCAFTTGNGRLVCTFHDEWPNKERISGE